jgi:hypothetical protein
MVDVCKCEGNDCPLKEKCYRFVSHPDPIGQSYFLEPPFKIKKECTFYWPIKKEKEKYYE